MHIKNRLPKVRDELLLINALSLVLLLVVIFFPSSILRSLIGIPFVLFFPGYVTLALLFPNKNDISVVERVALSLALSIVIISFLGLLLSFSPVGLKLFPSIISLYSLILVFSVIKWILTFKTSERKLKRLDTKQNQEPRLKLNLVLIFMLLIILLTLIRFLPTYGYASVPTQYEGEVTFNYNYLLNYGHFPERLPVYGIYNQNINRVGDPFIIIVFPHVYLQIITNLPNAAYFAFRPVADFRPIILSLDLSTILSLIALSIYQRYVRLNDGEPSLFEKIIIMTFSLSGSSIILLSLTGQNTGYGFVFFMVVMSLLLREKLDSRHTLLLLLFSFYLMIVYHTMALIFAVLMVIAIFYTFSFKQKIINYTYALTYLVTYGAYLVYIYTSFLGTTVHQLKKFIYVIIGKTQPYLTLKEVAFPQDISFLIIYGISVITYTIPLLFAFIYSMLPSISCRENSKEKVIFIVIFITFLLINMGFYSYMGTVGLLHRGKEYAAYFSVLAFSILLNNVTKKLKKILILCAIIAILTSTYVYLNSGVHNYHLTASEKVGNEWALKHITRNDVLFTDFRLSSMLVANGHFKVVGPLDPPRVSIEVLKERLHKIFYGDYPTKAIQSLKEITTTTGESPDYLIFSSRMAKGYPEPSIYVGESNVKPAPEDFLSKFDNSIQVNKIYNNQIIHIYQL